MIIIRKDEDFYGGISIGQSFMYEDHIYIKTQLNSNDVIAVNLKDGSSRVLTSCVRVKPINAKILVD